jgi:hypothetical protein
MDCATKKVFPSYCVLRASVAKRQPASPVILAVAHGQPKFREWPDTNEALRLVGIRSNSDRYSCFEGQTLDLNGPARYGPPGYLIGLD